MFIGIRFLDETRVQTTAGGSINAAGKQSVSDKECFPEMKQVPLE
jgi:hypothetical protein